MHLLAPLWLLLFLPWLALAIWAFIGRPLRSPVPFAHLWPRSTGPARSARKLHAPPIRVLLLLAAIAIAIVAASGPTIAHKIPWLPTDPPRGHIVVIVDRGLSIATYARPSNPFAAVAARLDRTLPVDIDIPIELQPVPGQSITLARASIAAAVAALHPTMLETDAAVATRIAQAARDPQAVAVVVISDREVQSNSPISRLPVSTDEPACWIAAAGATRGPPDRVLVRLAWTGPARRSIFTIASGGKTTRQSLDLAGAGKSIAEKTVIATVPALASTVTTHLEDLPLANYWLCETPPWPEVRLTGGALPDGVIRFVDVYRRDRPAGAGSPAIFVTPSLDSLGSNSGVACVEVAPSDTTIPGSHLVIADHPITRGIDFAILESSHLPSTTKPPPSLDWLPIVSLEQRPLIAVRQADANIRQVWISLSPDQWSAFARQPAFVQLMAAAFAWCSHTETSPRYRASSLPAVTDAGQIPSPLPLESVKPGSHVNLDGPAAGIYRISDGPPIALNPANPPYPGFSETTLTIGPPPDSRPTADPRPLLALLSILSISISGFVSLPSNLGGQN